MNEIENGICTECQSSLFAGHHKYYCDDCRIWYCPYCMKGYSQDDDFEFSCKHFVGLYFASGDVFDSCTSESESLEDVLKKVLTLAEEYDEEDPDSAKTGKSRIFGPLAVLVRDGWIGVSSFEKVFTAVKIPVTYAYNDEMGYFKVYFAKMGSARAWKILNAAADRFNHGLKRIESKAQNS